MKKNLVLLALGALTSCHAKHNPKKTTVGLKKAWTQPLRNCN